MKRTSVVVNSFQKIKFSLLQVCCRVVSRRCHNVRCDGVTGCCDTLWHFCYKSVMYPNLRHGSQKPRISRERVLWGPIFLGILQHRFSLEHTIFEAHRATRELRWFLFSKSDFKMVQCIPSQWSVLRTFPTPVCRVVAVYKQPDPGQFWAFSWLSCGFTKNPLSKINSSGSWSVCVLIDGLFIISVTSRVLSRSVILS
jgi:hypothetical protein